jgi:hypothetical protein
MHHKKRKLCALLLLGLCLTGLHAQVNLPVSAGRATGTGGLSRYSAIGQVVYTTNKGSGNINGSGTNQPYDISAIVTGIGELKGTSLQCTIYPNPTHDFLTLRIAGALNAQYFASLYDVNGKLLGNKKIEGNQTVFDMRKIASASYYLKVTDCNKELNSFLIIKN